MIVLGIDPGFARVGFALIDGTASDPKILECGILETAKGTKADLSVRYLEIANDLEYLIKKYKPEMAVIEDIFFFKNLKTAIAVAQARGIFLYLLAKYEIPIMEPTPLQVKNTLCGYGRATKDQVKFMVSKIFKITKPIDPDDAVDALAMAYMGLL